MDIATVSGKDVSETLSGTAYELLRDDIVAGRYEPETKLRIDVLCKKYKIGASPMREALSRLAEGSFVIAEPQRGYWVAPVSLAEYQDLVNQRLNLESSALIDSIEHGDVEWESSVVAAYHRLNRAHAKLADGTAESFIAWARADRAFHLATIANCSSPWLLRFCQLILNQLSRYHQQRYLSGVAPGDHTDQEHARFMRSVIERDTEKSVTLLKKHVRAVARRLAIDSRPQADNETDD